jgi:type III secretion protein U
LRNVQLARELHFRCDTDDLIPEDLFDAIAEVLTWAEALREQREAANKGDP